MDELNELPKKWRKRRERIRKQHKNIRRKVGAANTIDGNILFGRFVEIEKCTSELIRIINKIKLSPAEIKRKVDRRG